MCWLGSFSRTTRPARRAQQGAHGLGQHDGTERAEQHEVAERDDEIELAGGAQRGKGGDAADDADQARQHQVHREVQVDTAAAPIA